ncbi:MAG: GGDEF domain-containing protein [Lachnospiraceae bacterium]|nr:GGDEF domain-containing protein [Lachnospiraceae bacterium]
MYYSGIGVLSIIIHVIINFEAMRMPRNGINSPVRSRYRDFLNSALQYYVIDSIWGIAYASKIVPVAYADTALYFYAMSLSLLMWMRFIITYLNRKSLFNTVLKYSGGGIFVAQIVVLLINFKYPIMFWFDEAGEYYPGRARYIILTIQIILFVIIANYALICSARKGLSHKDRLHYLAIGFSGLMMSVFVILQTFYPFMPFYAIGCLLAGCIIHTYVLMDQRSDWDRELGTAREMAYKDFLTGVKNKTAFLEKKNFINRQISDNVMEDFGLVVFDLNDLKKVNDTQGHESGDDYIREASRIICTTFMHSPIYRVGGDEFVALLEGTDYNNREELLGNFDKEMEDNLSDGKVVISSGLSIFVQSDDKTFDQVFGRADTGMYERKKYLKTLQAGE